MLDTKHAGGRADADLSAVQRRRKWALLAAMSLALAFFVFGSSTWRESAPNFYETIEWAGMFLILVCIVGRTWCSLYIGGRKKEEIVASGPYSVVRNPLYVFTLIGAVGVGWQMGSLIMGAVCALGTYLIFSVVIAREEAFLRTAFPNAFTAYVERVPRLWPDFSLWSDTDRLVVSPKPVVRTFADTCVLLIAIPIAEGIDALQAAGSFPVFLYLP